MSTQLKSALADHARNGWHCTAVKQIGHLIEGPANAAIVYTDHYAAVGMVLQTNGNTMSTQKLNLRLDIQNYQQGFSIEIRHRFGRTNFVPDASLRLVSCDYGSQWDRTEQHTSTVDVFHVSLVLVGNGSKQRVMKDSSATFRQKDRIWLAFTDRTFPECPRQHSIFVNYTAGPLYRTQRDESVATSSSSSFCPKGN